MSERALRNKKLRKADEEGRGWTDEERTIFAEKVFPKVNLDLVKEGHPPHPNRHSMLVACHLTIKVETELTRDTMKAWPVVPLEVFRKGP